MCRRRAVLASSSAGSPCDESGPCHSAQRHSLWCCLECCCAQRSLGSSIAVHIMDVQGAAASIRHMHRSGNRCMRECWTKEPGTHGTVAVRGPLLRHLSFNVLNESFVLITTVHNMRTLQSCIAARRLVTVVSCSGFEQDSSMPTASTASFCLTTPQPTLL